MSEVIDKIFKTRNVLKEILSKDYITEDIQNFSQSEIVNLYETPNDAYDTGSASGCNFSIKHRFIENHNLNVIYYGFSPIGTNPTRITRNIKEKINNLYLSGIFNETDNCIIIIPEEVSDNIITSINELNTTLSEEDIDETVFESFEKNMKSTKHILHRRHFSKVFIFYINELIVNLSVNRFVPKHQVIRDELQIQEILENCNCTKKQLPVMIKNDIQARYNLAVQGDIMKITRTSKMSGEYPFYRFIK